MMFTNVASLKFPGSSDMGTITRTTALDDVPQYTKAVLLNVGSAYPGTNNRAIFSKQRNGAGGATGYHNNSIRTTGQINSDTGGTTSADSRSANSAGSIVRLETWHWIYFVYNPTTQKNYIYLGTLQDAVTEVAYAIQNTGAGRLSDASWDILIGNVSAFSIPWPGQIAYVGMWDKILTVDEMRQFQFHRTNVGRMLIDMPLGLHGNGYQIDYSGLGHHASLSGALVAQGTWQPDWDDDDGVGSVAAGGTTRGRPFGQRGTAFNGGRTFQGIINP